jgi:hypothetical protein
MRHALIMAITILAAGWAAFAPGQAEALSVSGTFNFRENVGPNTVGATVGDRLILGAVNIVPSGPPTTATAAQGATVVALTHLPQTIAPDQYFANLPFDPALTGAWAITATRDLETAGPVSTNAIVVPQLLPLVQNIQVVGFGLTPTLLWDLPDLTGVSVTRMRVRVVDAATRDVLAQFFLVPFAQPGGVPSLPLELTVPPGVLQYGRDYVFRIMLEHVQGGVLQSRSSAFSSAYSPVTVMAGDRFSLFSSREVFEAELEGKVVDDYSNPGYDVNVHPEFDIRLHTNAAMTAVVGETRYTSTFFSDLNLIVRSFDLTGQPLGFGYCAGCNGSFRLDFTGTSVGDAGGVFGVGFDVTAVGQRVSGFADRPAAFVTFGDGTTASLPLDRGFWAITAGARIRTIHVGGTDGAATNQMLIVIDNLTIGRPRVIGVAIDIKPGALPNSINARSQGTVPVAIYSTVDFDATTVDPRSVTLAEAPVVLTPAGTPMVSVQDVNGDALLDLVLHVETAAMRLEAGATEAVLEGQTLARQGVRGVDSIRLIP